MLVLLAFIASFGLTACGSSEEGSPDLSRKDIAAKADAICRKAQKTSAKIPMATNVLTEYKPALTFWAKFAPIAQQQVQAFSALKPDSETEADWNAFLAKSKATAAWLQKVRQKVDDRDPSLREEFKMIDPMLDPPTAVAKKLGLKSCA